MPSKPATNLQMNKQSASQEIGIAQEMILSPKSKTGIISKQSNVFYNNQQEKKKMLKSPDASDSGLSEFTPELNLGHPLQQKSSTYVPRQETMLSRQEEGVPVRMSAGIHNVGNQQNTYMANVSGISSTTQESSFHVGGTETWQPVQVTPNIEKNTKIFWRI